jgi:hypothetical protein
MPTTLETDVLEESQQEENATTQEHTAAEKIRVLYKGVRLQKKKTLSNSRQLSADEKKTAATALGTDPSRISLSSKLHDKNEPKVKAFRKALADVNSWFHDPEYTLPWPEATLRQVKKGKVMLDEQYEVVEESKTTGGICTVKYKQRVDGKDRIRQTTIAADEYKNRVRSAFQRFKAEGLRLIEIVKRTARELEREMPAIMDRQRAKLKNTFRAEDYIFSADDCALEISFPPLLPDSELAEIDPETFREEQERYGRLQREAVRIELARMVEQLIGWLDGLALALSKRELLDKEYEITAKSAVKDGKVTITYRDGERKEQELELAEVEAKRRISEDKNPRKFNNATASRLFTAVEEAKQRKEELGIQSESLDTALTQLQRLLHSENAESLPEALREDQDYAANFGPRCVAIASTLFEATELAPRRALLRRQMKSPGLQPQ